MVLWRIIFPKINNTFKKYIVKKLQAEEKINKLICNVLLLLPRQYEINISGILPVPVSEFVTNKLAV